MSSTSAAAGMTEVPATPSCLPDYEVQQILNNYGGGSLPEEAVDFANDYFGLPIAQQIEDAAEEQLEDQPSSQVEEMPNEDQDLDDERPILIDMQEQHNGHDLGEADDHGDGVQKFFESGCGCEKNCIQKFDKQLIIQSHLDSMHLDEYCNLHINHHHILMMGALNALTNTSTTVQHHSRGMKERSRSITIPKFRGIEVCRTFFNFAFGCGDKRFKNVKKQFVEEGIIPKQHQNVFKTSHARSMPLELRSSAVLFINTFALQHALVLPGRVPAYRNLDLKILPCSMSKRYIYNEYKDASDLIGNESVTLASWYKIWKDFCGHIVIQKPRSDLCPECQRNVLSLGAMQNLSEDEKEARLKSSLDHLSRVKDERKSYKDVVESSTRMLEVMVPPLQVGRHEPNSNKCTVHYSFDYAQQVHIPHSSQQVGPLYFLVGYKVGLFGVAIEPLGKFVLYIIPESCVTGKGSNIVISMLHHFFENFGLGEENAHCHADNCSGQNKNNYLMQYGVWRTMVGLHKNFKVTFLPVGHTKFAPDLYFGLFKKAFRRSDVNTLEDIKNVALNACPTSKSIIPHLVGTENGEVFVQSFDWQTLFATYKATRVPQLLQYFQFECNSDQPGQIVCKKTSISDSSVVINVFPAIPNIISLALPPIIYPVGLTPERQKYLYEHIRDFVKGDIAKDTLCPRPPEDSVANEGLEVIPETAEELHAPVDIGEPSGTSETSSLLPPPPKVRKAVSCSYCHEVGHRNQMTHGKASCPKRREDELSGTGESN